jgi:hypothetical protein
MLGELLNYVQEDYKSLSEKEILELVKKAKAQVCVAIIACLPLFAFSASAGGEATCRPTIHIS